MRRTFLAAIALTMISGGAAFAGEGCTVPEAEWQPEQALRQKLESEGWKINRIKIDDGCYEVYGFDGEGQRKETYFDPKTFAFVREG